MIEAAASKGFAGKRREAAPHRARQASPFLWLHLVCLDAPLVAVTWMWLFAQMVGTAIAPGAIVVLFLTAWLIYLLDRLGDSLALDPNVEISLRQRFCRRHREAWILGIGTLAMADAVLIATQLNADVLLAGAGVGLAAANYLLINRLRPGLWRALPLKEASVGFIFAAGTLVPLASGWQSMIWPAWLLFGTLCSLNCICIAAWERELDLAQARVSIATQFPRARRMIAPALLLVAGAACAIVPAVTASALLLLCVHHFRDELLPDTRTALADLVLLTPLAWAFL